MEIQLVASGLKVIQLHALSTVWMCATFVVLSNYRNTIIYTALGTKYRSVQSTNIYLAAKRINNSSPQQPQRKQRTPEVRGKVYNFIEQNGSIYQQRTYNKTHPMT